MRKRRPSPREQDALRKAFIAGCMYEYWGFWERGYDRRTDDGYPPESIRRSRIVDASYAEAARLYPDSLE